MSERVRRHIHVLERRSLAQVDAVIDALRTHEARCQMRRIASLARVWTKREHAHASSLPHAVELVQAGVEVVRVVGVGRVLGRVPLMRSWHSTIERVEPVSQAAASESVIYGRDIRLIQSTLWATLVIDTIEANNVLEQLGELGVARWIMRDSKQGIKDV